MSQDCWGVMSVFGNTLSLEIITLLLALALICPELLCKTWVTSQVSLPLNLKLAMKL